MQFITLMLTETSQAIEIEVFTKYRQFTSEHSIEQWVNNELNQLARTEISAESQVNQEGWFKRLFSTLRLQYLVQAGEREALLSAQSSLPAEQPAEVAVVDLLVGNTDWERLTAMGALTYERLIGCLRAMTAMEITMASSSADYITRYCTQYERFAAPLVEFHWLSLLRSIQAALQSSPRIAQAREAAMQRVSDQVIARPKNMLRNSVFMGRERIVSFSAVLGLLIVSAVVLWGGPPWQQSEQSQTIAPATAVKPIIAPTPEPPPPTPVSTPVASLAIAEESGFYVIGMAARDEASAQAEAQKRRMEGVQARVVYSSNWSGLTPNYYQVVYGIFANRGDTTALRKDLEQRGIKTYVMHSGQRVQR